MSINFSEYSLEDLKQIQKDLEKTIKSKAQDAKKTALQQIHNIANEHGLDLDEVLDGLKNPSKKKAKVAPKYQNPKNNSETWTGRGRKPKWVEQALSEGKSLSSLEI
ncbi:H-NS histone family protein [Litoribrevibacter albus]|uniref:Trans-acting regulatory protein hvrA n=1 Tax=Litoribrevibacter albus TaxID=1473156 RepID=A0AA37W781_9GAMM|nr:H-NS histone family protein [Litoribrevibacter albus]GLQ30959.1 trans-acting regulatory protein hvrA [Litoribrevibacter albus]